MKRTVLLIVALGAVVTTSGLGASAAPVRGSSSDANGDGKADIIAFQPNGIFACISTGTGFAPRSSWNSSFHGFYGSVGTTTADVTGDGKADAIAISNGSGFYQLGATVRVSNGTVFAGPAFWRDPYYGLYVTAFADVDGDGKADDIVVNSDLITVQLSTGTRFGSPTHWTPDPFYGSIGTYVADVNGDGKSDAIAVNNGLRALNGIAVRLSNGSTFGRGSIWQGGAYYGSRGTFFADINGDGKADVVVVNNNGVYARLSLGNVFGASRLWAPPFYGSHGTFIADVNGDGKADAVAVNDNSTSVRLSNGTSFTQGRLWGTGQCYGDVATSLS
jgi:hypothetical protein